MNRFFKRKLYDRLLQWKNTRKGKTAILVEGARRVGKSTLVKEFAQKEYESYILIDFNKASKRVVSLFDDLMDLDFIFLQLQAIYNVSLVARKSAIIFDEVQACPKARQAIKYLVEDGRYDYIETGSLISITKNTKGITIPSEEERVAMYPLDYEEFRWAMGDTASIPLLKQFFDKRLMLGQAHRTKMRELRLYMLVGGMPQAVQKYIDTHSFEDTDRVKRQILTLYRNSIYDYAGNYAEKVASIFDQIPSQLQKHEKKFKLADLSKDARMRDYDSAFLWLKDAMIINTCYNTTEPSIGLNLKREDSSLKCYLADTGLLISHAFDERGIISEELYQKILKDKLEMNSGMLIENIVAQMLKASGHHLFFYSNNDREDKDSRMEIDFLIAKSKTTSRHNISPIEVKSTVRYTTTSLTKCIKKYDKYLATPYVIHAADLKIENGIEYLPLYMVPLL